MESVSEVSEPDLSKIEDSYHAENLIEVTLHLSSDWYSQKRQWTIREKHMSETLKQETDSFKKGQILAISNDISFDQIFSFQLENYYKPGDLLITFSCSGASKNILKVINFAKSKKLNTVSFTGFASKKIQKITDINFNANIKNYGVSEDIFQSLLHMISQSIRQKFISKKNKNIIL